MEGEANFALIFWGKKNLCFFFVLRAKVTTTKIYICICMYILYKNMKIFVRVLPKKKKKSVEKWQNFKEEDEIKVADIKFHMEPKSISEKFISKSLPWAKGRVYGKQES